MNQSRVLIIDDREVVRQTLRNILIDFDCLFWEAEDGATALTLLEANEFDVVFLDLRLPDLSGIEILRKARSSHMFLGKVIILTGLRDAATQEEAKTLGAFRYLTKDPLDWEEITTAFVQAISAAEIPHSITKQPSELTRLVQSATIPRIRAPKKPKVRDGLHPRLLVLDDNHRWLDTVREVLGQEFELVLTTSPDEACKRVRKENFACAVLDMKLVGGVSGLDVLSRMRRTNPKLRAVILTGHPEYNTALESGRRGAVAYVSKGELATLSETVVKILAQDAKPTQVFLCYARSDLEKVSRLFHKLMGKGFLPWMDVRSILAGRKWEPEIRRAIRESDYFIFCLSQHSLYKEGTIRKEVNQALERQEGLLDSSIFFITARLEDCEVMSPFDKFQYVDLFKKDGFANLLEALEAGQKI